MNEKEWIQKAIAYFNGGMTRDGEQEQFLRETESNKSLSDLMKLWKESDEHGAVFELHRESVDDFIRTHNRLKSFFIKPLTSRSSSKQIWRGVAVAGLLTGLFYLSWRHWLLTRKRAQVISGVADFHLSPKL